MKAWRGLPVSRLRRWSKWSYKQFLRYGESKRKPDQDEERKIRPQREAKSNKLVHKNSNRGRDTVTLSASIIVIDGKEVGSVGSLLI